MKNNLILTKTSSGYFIIKATIAIQIFLFFGFSIVNAQNSGKETKSDFLDAIVQISGIKSGEIEKDKLLNSSGLTFDKSLDSVYKITYYKMTLVIKGQDLQELENSNTGELSSTMIDAIQNAPSGSKLFFEYIRCMDHNKIIHSVRATQFVLK